MAIDINVISVPESGCNSEVSLVEALLTCATLMVADQPLGEGGME
jgi:hypothetical protein